MKGINVLFILLQLLAFAKGEYFLGNTSQESACYGSTADSFVNLQCTDISDVIIIDKVLSAAKPLSLGCPLEVNETTIFDPDLCCHPNTTEPSADCTFGASLLQNFRRRCNGEHSCTGRAERHALSVTCAAGIYPAFTTYMTFSFYCVSGLSIRDICTESSSYEANTVYLRNRNYMHSDEEYSKIPDTDTNCTCAMTVSGGTIVVYTIHLELATDQSRECKQSLSIQDGDSAFTLSCPNAKGYSIEEVYRSHSSQISVRLQNTLGISGGRFWLAFQGETNDVTVTCSPPPPIVNPCDSSSDQSSPPPTGSSPNPFLEVLGERRRTSECFGSLFSIGCSVSEESLMLTDITVATKSESLGCPLVVDNDTIADLNETLCCNPGVGDCQKEYSNDYLHKLCNGKSSCGGNAVQDILTCSNGYASVSTFMSVDYYCLHDNSLLEMSLVQQTYTGAFGSIWNKGYKDSIKINPFDKTLSCSVETCSGPIYVFAVHLNLERDESCCKQELRFEEESREPVILRCDRNSGYTVTHVFTSSTKNVNVTLVNNLPVAKGTFWLFFQLADASSSLRLNCPSNGPQLTCTTHPPTTVPSTSTTTSSITTISTSSTTTTTTNSTINDTTSPPSGSNETTPVYGEKTDSANSSEDSKESLGLIAGVGGGAFVFLVLITVGMCFFLRRRNRQERMEASFEPAIRKRPPHPAPRPIITDEVNDGEYKQNTYDIIRDGDIMTENGQNDRVIGSADHQQYYNETNQPGTYIEPNNELPPYSDDYKQGRVSDGKSVSGHRDVENDVTDVAPRRHQSLEDPYMYMHHIDGNIRSDTPSGSSDNVFIQNISRQSSAYATFIPGPVN